MAQITVNIYIADQIYEYGDLSFYTRTTLTLRPFSYVARIIGTFVGLVVGLLAWYIGSSLYFVCNI